MQGRLSAEARLERRAGPDLGWNVVPLNATDDRDLRGRSAYLNTASATISESGPHAEVSVAAFRPEAVTAPYADPPG